MNLFNKIRRKTSSAVAQVEKMSETEAKLVQSMRDKPTDWNISRMPCDEGGERELCIIHARSGIRILMTERVAQVASTHGTVVGRASYGPYHFQSEFIKVFGALAYARYKIQDAENKKAASAQAESELKARVAQWK